MALSPKERPSDFFATEPIIGWRAWRYEITVDGPRLFSVWRPAAWEPGLQIEAQCQGVWVADHEPPGDDCKCGVYAVRSLDQIRELAYERVGTVFGQVALAGEVIEGERGYRAARAWILKLYVPHLDWPRTRPLERTYGVPVGVLNPYSDSEGG
jgi:hypothetical protein